jgi:sulfate adenylyltransferase
MSVLISPYGSTLINLLPPNPDAYQDLRQHATRLPSIQLSARAQCDLELLATGGFSPLQRFMNAADYQSVVHTMRLADGTLFPMPIVLPVADDAPITLDQDIALRDERNHLLAVMTVEEIFAWDRDEAAQQVFGTLDTRHPIVSEMHQWGRRCISGALRVLNTPTHHDFKALRLTPSEVRAKLEALGTRNVVAFQTRNPLHRAHEELTKRAAASVDGVLLLHPVVGLTRPGDVDHYTRVRTYKALIEHHYDPARAQLALLPLAMRMGGPREALWHAIIRRNHGANHLIVGRDHAGPGNDSQGKPFYGPYDAQTLAQQHAAELGMGILTFQEMVYLKDQDRYEEAHRVPQGAATASISGTQVREQYLAKGHLLPSWFTRPEVAQILAESYPPIHQQGVVLWFTGLSGAGKSATAEVLVERLLEFGRQSTLLDGDVVRTHLSRGLGFSREDRDLNIIRIGFVAAEIARHGGAVICAAISPYRATRDAVRAMVGTERFIEIFVDTPLDVCEARDSKGMYAKARRGEIKGFTGIDDPYEAPLQSEITLNTITHDIEENAQQIITYLAERGFVRILENDIA